jgi:hypothetical protein
MKGRVSLEFEFEDDISKEDAEKYLNEHIDELKKEIGKPSDESEIKSLVNVEGVVIARQKGQNDHVPEYFM